MAYSVALQRFCALKCTFFLDSNPLSSSDGGGAAVVAGQAGPDGIRLILTLPSQHPLAGVPPHLEQLFNASITLLTRSLP